MKNIMNKIIFYNVKSCNRNLGFADCFMCPPSAVANLY